MRYGFEREFFITNGPDYCLVPSGIPKDECGYLVEARGEPHTDVLKAAYLLMAEEAKLRDKLRGSSYRLSMMIDTIHLNPALMRAALRTHGKAVQPQGRRNLYGKDYGPRDRWQRAGLHVHFSNHRIVVGNNNTPIEVPTFFDPIPIIRGLDQKFKTEIREARRIPGMYELKPYGFEYRSLPSSIEIVTVARAIEKIILDLG